MVTQEREEACGDEIITLANFSVSSQISLLNKLTLIKQENCGGFFNQEILMLYEPSS